MNDNYYKREYEKLSKEVKRLEEIISEKDKKIKGLQSSEKVQSDMRRTEKNSIMIGGYSGISIPLDVVLKEQISTYIFKEVRNLMESNKDFEDKFIKQALNYRKAFVHIFKPIVKEMIEDLDFEVKFSSEDRDDK